MKKNEKVAEVDLPEIVIPEDSGNIEVVDCKSKTNKITLNIRADTRSGVFHWFYFGLKGKKGETYRLHLLNADKSPFSCWTGKYTDPSYSAVASYDEKTWFRVAKTEFKTPQLIIEITLEQEQVFFATFTPYPYARHQRLLNELTEVKDFKIMTIGHSVEKRPISVVQIGEPTSSTLKCWIIARQHPGESMAEWFMEGLIEVLKTRSESILELLKQVTFYLVPNMNPDGVFHGNLRVNARGQDLNRCWLNPDENNSPEVYFLLRAIREVGVDFFMDIHGEEQIPRVFPQTAWNKNSREIGNEFIKNYKAANRHVQTDMQYPVPKQISTEYLKLAHYSVGERFGCTALLLEMPFKAWSVEDSQELGKSLLQPLIKIVPALRSSQKTVSSASSGQNIFDSKFAEKTGDSSSNCLIL